MSVLLLKEEDSCTSQLLRSNCAVDMYIWSLDTSGAWIQLDEQTLSSSAVHIAFLYLKKCALFFSSKVLVFL